MGMTEILPFPSFFSWFGLEHADILFLKEEAKKKNLELWD